MSKTKVHLFNTSRMWRIARIIWIVFEKNRLNNDGLHKTIEATTATTAKIIIAETGTQRDSNAVTTPVTITSNTTTGTQTPLTMVTPTIPKTPKTPKTPEAVTSRCFLSLLPKDVIHYVLEFVNDIKNQWINIVYE